MEIFRCSLHLKCLDLVELVPVQRIFIKCQCLVINMLRNVLWYNIFVYTWNGCCMSRLAVSRDPELDVYEMDMPLSNEPTLPRRCGFSFPTIKLNQKEKKKNHCEPWNQRVYIFINERKKEMNFKLQKQLFKWKWTKHIEFWTNTLGLYKYHELCVCMCVC